MLQTPTIHRICRGSAAVWILLTLSVVVLAAAIVLSLIWLVTMPF